MSIVLILRTAVSVNLSRPSLLFPVRILFRFPENESPRLHKQTATFSFFGSKQVLVGQRTVFPSPHHAATLNTMAYLRPLSLFSARSSSRCDSAWLNLCKISDFEKYFLTLIWNNILSQSVSSSTENVQEKLDFTLTRTRPQTRKCWSKFEHNFVPISMRKTKLEHLWSSPCPETIPRPIHGCHDGCEFSWCCQLQLLQSENKCTQSAQMPRNPGGNTTTRTGTTCKIYSQRNRKLARSESRQFLRVFRSNTRKRIYKDLLFTLKSSVRPLSKLFLWSSSSISPLLPSLPIISMYTLASVPAYFTSPVMTVTSYLIFSDSEFSSVKWQTKTLCHAVSVRYISTRKDIDDPTGNWFAKDTKKKKQKQTITKTTTGRNCCMMFTT